MADKKKDEKKYPSGPSFKEFIWNPETSEFLGRTLESWIKITVFYIIFYIALAAFFGFCLYIFHQTLEDKSPKWTLSSSIIGTNPGLGFRPMPDQEKNPESTLIWYKQSDEKDVQFWSGQLETFLTKYENRSDSNLISCDYGDDNKATHEKACRVDLTQFPITCSKTNNYGYRAGEPCIILKLNKIYGWQPEGYGLDSTGKYNEKLLNDELEEAVKDKGMPEDLSEYIKKEVAKHKPESFLNTVWFSCEGENPTDKENLGPVEFFPQPGVPGFYYPYYNQDGYQTPIVFAKLKKPVHGVLINIECKAWAKNVHPNRLLRLGSVHFEILID